MNKDFNFIVKLTTACPGNCKCCKNRQKNFKTKNENNYVFPLQIFEKICKNIRNLGGSYIGLSGGEPTILKNLEQYILVAKKYGLATRINTNGWNLNEENLKLFLKNGLDQIVISIYGLDQNTILKTRGNNQIYEKSINAINAIKKLKNKYKFIFIIQTIIMKENYTQMPNILEFAIDNGANLFWPSYLEDAINLPDIRLSQIEIEDFKKNIIPKMRNIIKQKNLDDEIISNIEKSLKSYYNDDINMYNYHADGENCHWVGKHFTFYPNGTVDPCPGHEYFQSDYQFKIDYKNIDDFMSYDNLTKYKNVCFDYCKNCPQGKHREISFMAPKFHEHDGKEVL